MPIITTVEDALRGESSKLKTKVFQRMPYACVIPGTCNSIDNSRGALHYCDHCQARITHRRCIRDLARIEQKLTERENQLREHKQVEKAQRARYNMAARGKRAVNQVMGSVVRNCAERDCKQPTTGKYCRRHSAKHRERRKRLERAIAHARVAEAKIDRVIAKQQRRSGGDK